MSFQDCEAFSEEAFSLYAYMQTPCNQQFHKKVCMVFGLKVYQYSLCQPEKNTNMMVGGVMSVVTCACTKHAMLNS